MNHDAYTNEYIAAILRETKTVAVVGASANEVRPSFFVTRYMIDKGYDVYPINPGHVGKEIAGRLTYAHLADVPVAIDMVDVFRGSAFIPALVPQDPRPEPAAEGGLDAADRAPWLTRRRQSWKPPASRW